ncbi:hypothetical protein LJ707_04870 [Mucilaginibacter sp. UR6-1]|uniref:hypothetical protein n=1 Tax=Mucilaginibacter sp. UR6-1 TaxID=1435643 RepID=UPI001E630A26|nr:hypothetical protein [Mucilaginibacter sp. UR6-1]MCC8408251.1 hypothetical protein [Mucilaginibacter sp. UR6-1]
MKDTEKVNTLIKATLTGAALLVLYSFIFDLVYDIANTFDKIKQVLMYLLEYLIFRSWIIAFLIIFYYQLFKNAHATWFIALKILFVVGVSFILALHYGKDDWSITINMPRNEKYIPVYTLSGLTLWMFFSDILKRKSENALN